MKGFAIHCPHCFQWSHWDTADVNDWVVSSPQECDAILQDLRSGRQSTTVRKMLTCQHHPDLCPLTWQTFILPRDSTYFQSFVHEAPSWTAKRVFRLFAADRHNRWEDYLGVMVCSSRVVRIRHIELERLIDRHILRNAITGMSEMTGNPVRVYSARAFQVGNMTQVSWLPLDVSPLSGSIADGAHAACTVARAKTRRVLSGEYDARINVTNCPLKYGSDKRCADRAAQCLTEAEKREWDLCPAFAETRRDADPCLRHEAGIVQKVVQSWQGGTLEPESVFPCKCWQGFPQSAVPIIVHDHLVAVAVACHLNRSPHAGAPVSPSEATSLPPPQVSADYCASDQSHMDGERHTPLNKTAAGLEVLAADARWIGQVANSRYLLLRSRLETMFRAELMSSVPLCNDEEMMLAEFLPSALNRMRAFWAFEYAHLVLVDVQERKLRLRAESTSTGSPRYYLPDERILGQMRSKIAIDRPQVWIVRTGDEQTYQDDWKMEAQSMFECLFQLGEASGIATAIACIPVSGTLYSFVFASRDTGSVSPLASRNADEISDVCREAILELCTEMGRRFAECRQQNESAERTQVAAMLLLSRKIAHLIGNHLDTAYLAVEGVLRRLACTSTPNEDDLTRRLRVASKHLKEADATCDKVKRLVAEAPLNIQDIDPNELVRSICDERKEVDRDRRYNFVRGVNVPVCRWAADQVRDAVLELASNARDFTDIGKAITFRVGVVTVAGRQVVRIEVINEGRAITPEKKLSLFKLFYTTKVNGTGIGLWTVDNVARAHGGRVYEDAEMAETVRFVVELPPMRQRSKE